MAQTENDKFLQLLCSVDAKNIRLAFELAKGNTDYQTIFDGYVEVYTALFKAGYDNYMFYAGAELEEVPVFSVDEKYLARDNQATAFQADFVEYIPASIKYFTRLTYLSISGSVKEVPKELGKLVNLEELNLRGNQLIRIPKEIGQLQQLRVLNLTDNYLASLPIEIKGLNNLECLFLENNRISMVEKEKINSWLPNCVIDY